MKTGKSKEAAIRICKASVFDEGVESLSEDEMVAMEHMKKEMYNEMFSEVVDKAWSKKIIDKLYAQGLDATKFEWTLNKIHSYFMKNQYWKMVKNLDDATIDEIIASMAQMYPTETQNYNEKATTFWSFSDLGEFKEVKEGDKVQIQIMRTGKWKHPMYGEVIITPQTINDVVENFNSNTRGIDIAVDENHEENHKALGWFRELKKQGKDALNATIELTKMGAELINQGAYKYFSPEIAFNKRDEET